MNKNIQKITKTVSVLGLGAVASLSSVAAKGGLATTPTDKLGIQSAFGDAGLTSLNFQSVVTIAFQILLAAAVLWVVYNIVMAGIKIAGAKEDADKRKEGLKSIINAAIGLVVALSAYAIVQIVQNQLTGGTNATLGTPCIDKTTGKAGFLDESAATGATPSCIPSK